MATKGTQCDCLAEHVVGIEYDYTNPERYDGVSEFLCNNCKRRWGRWTGKELFEDDVEKRYGRE